MTWACSRTITLKCEDSTFTAPWPTQAPSATAATGTVSSSALAGQLGYSGILVPPSCISSLTLPPAESTSRTSGKRNWCAMRSM